MSERRERLSLSLTLDPDNFHPICHDCFGLIAVVTFSVELESLVRDLFMCHSGCVRSLVSHRDQPSGQEPALTASTECAESTSGSHGSRRVESFEFVPELIEPQAVYDDILRVCSNKCLSITYLGILSMANSEPLGLLACREAMGVRAARLTVANVI